jgi:hypothetical protein
MKRSPRACTQKLMLSVQARGLLVLGSPVIVWMLISGRPLTIGMGTLVLGVRRRPHQIIFMSSPVMAR